MLQTAKLQELSYLSFLKLKTQILDKKLQNLGCALIGFSLALVWYFLNMPSFLRFIMLTNILFKFFCFLILQGFTVKRLTRVSKEELEFAFLNAALFVRDYGDLKVGLNALYIKI